MNTVVATLFLILVFAVNGSALDEKNSNVDSPLMMFGDRGKKTNQNDRANFSNIAINRENQEQRNSEISCCDDDDDDDERSAQTIEEDVTQDDELEKEDKKLLLLSKISRKIRAELLKRNPDETARELFIQNQTIRLASKNNNVRSLTSLPQDVRASAERHQLSHSFQSSFNQTPLNSSSLTSYGSLTQTGSRSPNIDLPSTTPPRPSWRWPDRHDSLHPVKLTPTVISDTIVSAILVSHFFNINYKYSVPAWLLGNILASAVASHHLTTAIEARSPNWARNGIKAFVTSNDYWNPVYFTYYTLAWSIMGMDKSSFNVTPLQAASFMVISGMIRQQANVWINKRNPLSWDQNTRRIVKKNPFLWNQENIDAIASAPRNQAWRACWEYAPDVIGAFARSGASNVYSYLQGNALAETIIPSTVRSGAIYTGGLFSYYVGYRLIEYASYSCYKEAPAMDQKRLRKLYLNIQRAATYGVLPSPEGINSSQEKKQSPFLIDINTKSMESSISPAKSSPANQEEQTALLTTPNRTPNRNLIRSSSSRKLILSPVLRKTLEVSLKVLRSHWINYFKDSLFYRMENPCQEPTQKIKQAYAIIDLLDMYKAHVANPTINKDQIQEASQQLIAALKTNHSDVESNLSSYEQSIEPTHLEKITPLLDLFSQYSSHDSTADNHKTFELTPLKKSQQGEGGYESVHDELSSDSDADDDGIHVGL